MAGRSSFTFGAGNARKVLAIPLYALGQLAAVVVPRDPRRWAVGSGFGVHDGALAVVQEARRRSEAPAVTWLVRNEVDASRADRLGIRHVPRDSLRGWWTTLRSGVVVLTHGFGDVNRYGAHGAVVAQLWHGAPLKRLHLDSPAALTLPLLGRFEPVRRLLRAMYRRGTRRISVLPVSSHTVVPRMASAFALPPDRVPILGEPRTDVLFAGTEQDRVDAARRRLAAVVGELHDATVILYAPTWRDGAVDPALPDASQWTAVTTWLEHRDAVLLVRQHPLGAGRYDVSNPRVRLLPSSAEPEVNAVLWGVDALLTDYSSVLFDFAVTGRPIVHFAPDVESYERSHGFYEPHAQVSGGVTVRTWEQALRRLDSVLDPGAENAAARQHTRALADRYHEHHDGRSAARVVDHVLELVSGARSVATDSVPEGPGSDVDARGPVLFESYYGRNVACNPAALDRELTRRWPTLERYWSVASLEVKVPDGAVPVVVGTPQWHAARDRASLIVTNDWIRDRWRPRRDQTVLQTWHGTPLKRIALGRRGMSLRERAAVVKQSHRWSIMLAQSPAASRVLRRAYAVRAPMWVEGYPRNDVIVQGAPDGLRQSLGVTTPRVVLYAPTWRDTDLAASHPLDVEAFAEALGDEWTVLVRGHARTMYERSPSVGERVIDVTRYPDVSPLLATADVLVTDYSSVMFDFSASRRPMVFHVPDLAEYADRGRGVYWDLADRAPGPLVTTTGECADRVRAATSEAPGWAQRYSLWRADFNPFDDGGASTRVVDRLVREGFI